MIQRPIYEYPKELLWHPKSMKWYLENDPNGLHKGLADTLLQIRKEGVNISNIEQVLNDAYCIAVTVATTEVSKYSNLSGNLFYKYHSDIALLCGCVILLSHKNYEEYQYTVEEIINNTWEDFDYYVSEKEKLKYQSIKKRIINCHKTSLQIDLSPDAFVENEMTIQWLMKNMSLQELETIIKFHRTKNNQLDFLDGIIYKYFVEDRLSFNHKEKIKTLFTITPEELEKYKENVNKGLYLKKADEGLPEMPQATDTLQIIDNWREDCENRIKILSEENEMLQKRCERIELNEKVKVLFNDEQRDAQELINILKNQLEEKDRKVKELTNDVETFQQKINTVIGEKYWVIEKKEMLEKENRAFKKKTEILEMQNDMLERKNTELENKNNNLNLEIKSLIEKNSEWEALYASGFAGSAVVESDEGAKVVNSDAARENENYKKEIEEKETLINDLSNKLKNQSIPMSAIIEGFRKLALIDTKEVVLMVFKSLGIILSKCNAWTNSEDEILRIFVEQNTPSSGTVNNYYGSGANHFDYHRELTIKKEDNKSLEKK